MLERLKKSLDEDGFIIYKQVTLRLGNPWIIEVAATTREEIAITIDFCILGKGLTKTEDNPENRAMLAEHFALPRVSATAPFKEVLWTISRESLKGSLTLPLNTVLELSSINRPGLVQAKQHSLWLHSLALIAKARDPNHVWTVDSL